MKANQRSTRALAILLLVFSIAMCAAQPPPVRILPLGDSITFGSGITTRQGGYRNHLHTLLKDAGYQVDFVGTKTDSDNPSLPDKDHEGNGGFRIDQIQANLSGWLDSIEDPDVVLLLIGTNDFSQNFNIQSAGFRLSSLIGEIATKRPFAKILVSNLPPRTDNASLEAEQAIFNSSIPGIVSNQVSLGRSVYYVNMHDSLNAEDLSDGVHPSTAGYDNMATIWCSAVTQIISPFGTSDAPAMVDISPTNDLTQVTIRFSKPLADSATDISNYSLNGGVLVTEASLDAETHRIITLTTSPQAAGEYYTLTVNGVRDRTPQQNLIAANSTLSFSAGDLHNGSFETDLADWSVAGNVVTTDMAPYTATHGNKIAVFNGGDSTPNGTLSQTFTTIPGHTYRLEFDAGVLGYLVQQQQLEVILNGSSTLLTQTVNLTGTANGVTRWLPQQFIFIADSASTTLTFRDVSTTSYSLDLLLDHVRVSATAPIPVRTLAVHSSLIHAIPISMTPSDNGGNSHGDAPFSRRYFDGATVTLTAPANHSSWVFSKWRKNGSDFSTTSTTSVSMTSDLTMTAIYVANTATEPVVSNGSFESGLTPWSLSGSAVLQTGAPYPASDGNTLVVFNGANSTPNGVLSQTLATIPGITYTLAFDLGVLSFSTSEQKMSVRVVGSGELLSETVVVSRSSGSSTVWTPQTFTFVANSPTSTLTFTDISTTTSSVDLTLDHIRVTGNASPQVVNVNGSFESGLTSWTASGSGNTVLINNAIPATNGLSLIQFNGGSSANDGKLSQVVATTAGATYRVNFDVGILADTSSNQTLRFQAEGNGLLTDQSITLNGTGSGGVQWTTQSHTFTANSSSTTLIFSDQSTTTVGVDLLLDNVRLYLTQLGFPPTDDEIFGITLLKRANGVSRISTEVTAPGRYFLERSQNLKTWTYHSERVISEAGKIEFVDRRAPAPRVFYRIGYTPSAN